MKLRNILNFLPLVLVGIGTISFISWEKSDRNQFPRTDAPPLSERWYVSKISDGDTLTVRQEDGSEMKIRLCGIDAPERSQPLGRESTEHLRSLIQQTNGEVQVVPVEKDRYGRTVAEVFTVLGNQEKLLNAEQLSSGNAYLYKQYAGNCPNKLPLETAEEIAREKHLGVWNGTHIKPWDYRGTKRR